MSTRRSPHGDVGQMKEEDGRSSVEASPLHETVKVEKVKEMVKLEKGKEKNDDGKKPMTPLLTWIPTKSRKQSRR
jgi:hypothetical protein